VAADVARYGYEAMVKGKTVAPSTADKQNCGIQRKFNSWELTPFYRSSSK
jgi:hypothetical protein